mmetsp:Transcript_114439/g.296454  ORF Transcript_114439/g.296454 Transcript_114439/m.296454 type:complete len:114 (+) Transcript_114439:2098-2439(+)
MVSNLGSPEVSSNGLASIVSVDDARNVTEVPRMPGPPHPNLRKAPLEGWVKDAERNKASAMNGTAATTSAVASDGRAPAIRRRTVRAACAAGVASGRQRAAGMAEPRQRKRKN